MRSASRWLIRNSPASGVRQSAALAGEIADGLLAIFFFAVDSAFSALVHFLLGLIG